MSTQPARLSMELTKRKACALELRPGNNPDQAKPSHVLPFKGSTHKQAVRRILAAGHAPSEWAVEFVYPPSPAVRGDLSAEVARLRALLQSIAHSAESALPAAMGPARYDLQNILTLARSA